MIFAPLMWDWLNSRLRSLQHNRPGCQPQRAVQQLAGVDLHHLAIGQRRVAPSRRWSYFSAVCWRTGDDVLTAGDQSDARSVSPAAVLWVTLAVECVRGCSAARGHERRGPARAHGDRARGRLGPSGSSGGPCSRRCSPLVSDAGSPRRVLIGTRHGPSPIKTAYGGVGAEAAIDAK